MKLGRRGSVLGYVLVMVVCLGYVSSLIMSARMQTSKGAANDTRRTKEDLAVQSAANSVSAAWALAGATCASNRGLGVSCAGSGCDCVCRLSSGARVSATPSGAGSSCRLSVEP
jgi:type IV secretory pathway TrbL component